METAIIALLSAVLVALIAQVGAYIKDRKAHKEMRSDKKEDQSNEILSEVRGINNRIDDVYGKIDSLEARQARVRVLRFDDELLQGVRHTHDHWRQILEDVDIYEDYCNRHPDFKNGVAKHAMSHIKNVYDEVSEKRDFLL